jgi:aerobactin synthase
MKNWVAVNRSLIAKSVSELDYEQILSKRIVPAQEMDPNSSSRNYLLSLESGVSYSFTAKRGIWGNLRVRPETLRRLEGSRETPQERLEAGQFFIDARKELGMDEIVLGNFLEEMHSTLYADLALLESNRGLSVSELAELDGDSLQSYLNGHPKILLNKGRIGWGSKELDLYSPESRASVRFVWIAVQKNASISGFSEGFPYSRILEETLSNETRERFSKVLETSAGSSTLDEFLWMPIHPWQWERVIRLQFASALAKAEIVFLGEAPGEYLPQTSIRTFSPSPSSSTSSKNTRLEVKLPLTILNTSAVRGIPSRYIPSSPALSDRLSRLCAEDSLLREKGTTILREVGGISVAHPLYRQVPGAPYRYAETLGVIWRESPANHLAEGEKAVMTGSLFHVHTDGGALIGEYIRRSGISVREWLSAYFDSVVVPLYHLQVQYGIGLVAHGQNVVLKLRDFVPCGAFLKDFQGDLRRSNHLDAELDSSLLKALSTLDVLPPNYLIHDLVTGHFLTVLRFVSAVLEDREGFSEKDFYSILRERLDAYLAQRRKDRASAPIEAQNLFRPKLERVLLNKVRFKIGYADSPERPLPLLGTDLMNPLAIPPSARIEMSRL